MQKGCSVLGYDFKQYEQRLNFNASILHSNVWWDLTFWSLVFFRGTSYNVFVVMCSENSWNSFLNYNFPYLLDLIRQFLLRLCTLHYMSEFVGTCLSTVFSGIKCINREFFPHLLQEQPLLFLEGFTLDVGTEQQEFSFIQTQEHWWGQILMLND